MNRFLTSGIAALIIAAGPALAKPGMRAGENHLEDDALYATTQAGAGVISDRMSEPGYLSGLHHAIESNRPLLARLESQNVEISNVIGAEPAANGSMTFYVQ
jgi:hypothetical protein